MEFEYKNIGGRLVKLRRKSDSSVDSLAPTDIPHPSRVKYTFYSGRRHICPLTHNLMEGNAVAFRNLVLKGQRLKRRRWKIYEGHIRHICYEHRRNNRDFNFLFWHGGKRDNFDAHDDYWDVYSKSKVGKYGSERKHLYVEVIAFLLKFEDGRDKDVRERMKECFFLLWDVMPFPYVRIQEMRKMLEDEWTMKCTSDFTSILERVIETYRNEFSDISVGDVQPRELQHLCRCKIRLMLWHNRRKEGHQELKVDSLFINGSPLPQLLVSYLRVVDRGIIPLQESGLGSRVRPDIEIHSDNSSDTVSSPNDPHGTASFLNDPHGSASLLNDPHGSESSSNDPHDSAISPNDPHGSASSLDDSFGSAKSVNDSSGSESFMDYNYFVIYYDNCSD